MCCRLSYVASTYVSKMEPRSPMVIMVAKDMKLRSSGRPPNRTAWPAASKVVKDLIPPPAKIRNNDLITHASENV